MISRMTETSQQEACLTTQIDLEKLFNKNQLLPRIRDEFINCKEFNFLKYIESCGINVEFGIELLAQMALHKRATLPTMVGILRRFFRNRHGILPDASQLAADELLKAAQADLVDWNDDLAQFIVKFEISQDVQEELDRFQYPLPMVVPPRPVRTNTDTGYVLGRGSLILKDNHHDDDICLDHINRMNAIRFTTDHETARMVKNQWRNLDKPKEGESKQDFEKRKRAFEKYDRTVKDVMTLLSQHSDHFYLTHKYDKRGRVYCQGYHVNYQGAPWNKAVIQLADKEHVE